MPTKDPNPADGCPKCQGPLWDNRATKKNPKQPDYRCKDRNCDGVIWPPKGGNGAPAPQASNAKQAYSTGPHIPGIDGPYSEASADVESGTVFPKIDKALSIYTVCWKHAVDLAKQDVGNDATHEGIAAQAATMFIQICNRGLAA